MRSSAKRCQTKSSASLLFNNLASNGKHVAYVHVKESVLLPESAVISGSSASGTHIVEPEASTVHQVRWVEPIEGAAQLLAIATSRHLHFYSAEGKRQLHSVPVPPGPEPKYFRGIGGCQRHVFVGCSNGQICRIPLNSATTFGSHTMLKARLPMMSPSSAIRRAGPPQPPAAAARTVATHLSIARAQENRGEPITDLCTSTRARLAADGPPRDASVVVSADGTGQLAVMVVDDRGNLSKRALVVVCACVLLWPPQMRGGRATDCRYALERHISARPPCPPKARRVRPSV